MGIAPPRKKAATRRRLSKRAPPPIKKPKKKKDKPKHLKRKLEGAANETERQEILDKIRALDATKKVTVVEPTTDDNATSQHTDTNTDELIETVPAAPMEETKVVDSMQKEQQEGTELKADNKERLTEGALKEDSPTDNGPKRQRGKRRRGRKDTSELVQATTNDGATEAPPDDDTNKTNSQPPRYCLGRKPVTDFTVGEYYDARIVYSKPFGVFFDIGCHSDAFCHVSRLSDAFVEDVEAWCQERETIKVRVMDVDRKRKRITVSLQSEARRSDEMASLQAWQQRKRKVPEPPQQEGTSNSSMRDKKRETPTNNTMHAPEHFPEENGIVEQTHAPPTTTQQAARPIPTDPKAIAAEQKRQRKLARRAARRALKEEGDDAEGSGE